MTDNGGQQRCPSGTLELVVPTIITFSNMGPSRGAPPMFGTTIILENKFGIAVPVNRLERPIVVGAVQARARARWLQHRQRDAARHHASIISTPHRLTTVRAVARPFARVVTAPEQSGSRRSAQRTTMVLVMKNGHRSARRSQYSPSTCFEQLHCAAPTAVPGTFQRQSNRRPTRELRLEPRTAAGSDTAELKSRPSAAPIS